MSFLDPMPGENAESTMAVITAEERDMVAEDFEERHAAIARSGQDIQTLGVAEVEALARADAAELRLLRGHVFESKARDLVAKCMRQSSYLAAFASMTSEPVDAARWEVVHVVTRSQLLDLGELVDVSTDARQAGFRIPVALSRAVWADCVQWTEEDRRRQCHQDQSGRLWDVLWMAYLAARRTPDSGALTFDLFRQERGSKGAPTRVTLKMLCGPGDSGEPVITILQPQED